MLALDSCLPTFILPPRLRGAILRHATSLSRVRCANGSGGSLVCACEVEVYGSVFVVLDVLPSLHRGYEHGKATVRAKSLRQLWATARAASASNANCVRITALSR